MEDKVNKEEALIKDNRELVVLKGDKANAMLPRYELLPFSGRGSGLVNKSLKEEGEDKDG